MSTNFNSKSRKILIAIFHENVVKIKIAFIIFLFLFQICLFERSAGEEFSFHQELSLPFVTEDMVHQPLDIVIHFSNPCWAIDEEQHSVRVFYSDGKREREIESQIYNLSFGSGEHINSCNLVFLLQGAGKYFVYYDDERTSSPNYPDHVVISDDSYYYEPIPGYFVDVNYYRITEDGYSLYGIGQEGTFLGIDMSQKVVKQLNGKEEFHIGNWGQLASFAMFWYEDRDRGTDEKMRSKQILVDGNLMVKVGIVSTSQEERVETTSFYTYYYFPGEEKRLLANVRHEVLQDLHINEIIEEDGMYAYLLTVRGRSASISKLNLGYIPPYLHVNSENGFQEYRLNQNPESKDYQWVLSTTDDIDLGSPPWFSIDEGEKGRAYALVFDRNENITDDEQDGIQVKAVERQEIGVPGLEIDGGGISGGRNSYESGGIHSLEIPQGFSAEFVAEFFSSPDGGLPSVEKEAQLFHTLLPYRAGWQGLVANGEKKEGYNVTVFTHLAPSFPFSSTLSAVTGKKFPIVSAEIWNQGAFISSGVSSRISFFPSSSPENIRGIISSMDWRNFSFIKKVTFPHIPPSDYVIRIYREGNDEKYIGATYASIDGDATVHVFCKRSGKIEVSLHDQHQKGVEDAHVFVTKEKGIFSINSTDESGKSILLAPSPSFYNLKVVYRGFIALNETIFLSPFLPLKKTAHIELHDVDVRIKDTLDFRPGVSLSLTLKSKGNEDISFIGEESSAGNFIFSGIPPGEYLLFLKYKSFSYEEECSIPEMLSYEVQFPAVYSLTIKAFTSRGTVLKSSVSVIREGIFIEKNGGQVSTFLLPPASYEIVTSSNGKVIGKRSVFLTESTHLDIVTTKKSTLFLFLEGLCVASGVFLAFLFLSKKISLSSFVLLLVFLLLAFSFLSPWWYFHGKGNGDITTTLFLIPQKMITIGRMGTTLNGEIAALPSSFELMLSIVSSLLIASMLFLFFSLFTKRTLFFLSFILIIGAIVLFSYGMSAFSGITTGSFFGNGEIFVSIPGASEELMECMWLPGSGYFLSIFSAIVLFIFFFFKLEIKHIIRWKKNR